jgi:nitrite reductase/ring-hydroxylating ferredoxin subunit
LAKHNLGPVTNFPEGEQRLVEVDGRSIGVFNVRGRLFALRNKCPHQGGPLCAGRVIARLESDRPGDYRYDDDQYLVECPWHGWEFDLANGQSWFDPERTRVRPYPVMVEPLPTEPTPGPYVAETFPVSVQQAHVFVEVGP